MTGTAAGLDEYWCSDCQAMALFERLTDASASEWACTLCGAAYFDAIDLVIEPTGRLGVLAEDRVLVVR
jgi:hypothetical protein